MPKTLTIASTPDERWREWALHFLVRADVILIGGIHLSENLHWELRRLRQHMKPEPLIFACGATRGR